MQTTLANMTTDVAKQRIFNSLAAIDESSSTGRYLYLAVLANDWNGIEQFLCDQLAGGHEETLRRICGDFCIDTFKTYFV